MGFGSGFGVAVSEEGVADGVEAMVVELYGVIENVSVFILRIGVSEDFFVYVIVCVFAVNFKGLDVINSVFNGLFRRVSVNFGILQFLNLSRFGGITINLFPGL